MTPQGRRYLQEPWEARVSHLLQVQVACFLLGPIPWLLFLFGVALAAVGLFTLMA